MANRLRTSTLHTKKHMINSKILPYLKDIKISAIKPATIRQCQNAIIGLGYAETYLKVIHNQLCAILNYAVKYYGLSENPCHKAGSMGKKHAKDMEFWIRGEYLRFA